MNATDGKDMAESNVLRNGFRELSKKHDGDGSCELLGVAGAGKAGSVGNGNLEAEIACTARRAASVSC